MFMEKAYKYRLYPNKVQENLIQKTFGCSRFVYNYYLDKRVELYNNEHKTMSYYDCSKNLIDLKQELQWLREVDKDALQKSLKDLDTAYKNFFTLHSGFPKFKSKKDRHKSYRTSCTNNNIKYLGKHIQLPKLGKIKITDRMIPYGRILNATVSQDPDGKYYCSLCCTDIAINPLPKTNNKVGIDLGIVDFAVQSDGIRIINPRFFEQSENKLAKLQREMSRKTIGGSNWNKSRVKVARLQKHIEEQRRDFLQKLTTNIVREYNVICLEDLSVSEMILKKQETNALTKVRNKHITDVSWAEFRRQLEYKCEWYGKELRFVDKYYPSTQICHVCNTLDGKKDESIRMWTCPHCGTVLDRDLNAAINILHNAV